MESQYRYEHPSYSIPSETPVWTDTATASWPKPLKRKAEDQLGPNTPLSGPYSRPPDHTVNPQALMNGDYGYFLDPHQQAGTAEQSINPQFLTHADTYGQQMGLDLAHGLSGGSTPPFSPGIQSNPLIATNIRFDLGVNAPSFSNEYGSGQWTAPPGPQLSVSNLLSNNNIPAGLSGFLPATKKVDEKRKRRVESSGVEGTGGLQIYDVSPLRKAKTDPIAGRISSTASISSLQSKLSVKRPSAIDPKAAKGAPRGLGSANPLISPAGSVGQDARFESSEDSSSEDEFEDPNPKPSNAEDVYANMTWAVRDAVDTFGAGDLEPTQVKRGLERFLQLSMEINDLRVGEQTVKAPILSSAMTTRVGAKGWIKLAELLFSTALRTGDERIMRRFASDTKYIVRPRGWMHALVKDKNYDSELAMGILRFLMQCRDLTPAVLTELKFDQLLKKLEEKTAKGGIKQLIIKLREAAVRHQEELTTGIQKQAPPRKPSETQAAGAKKAAPSSQSFTAASRPVASKVTASKSTTETSAATKKSSNLAPAKSATTNAAPTYDLKSASKSSGLKTSLFQSFAQNKPAAEAPSPGSTSNAKESFMSILAGMNKKADSPVKEAPIEVATPETDEEKQNRLRRESRNHNRVVFKRDAELHEVHVIENRDELQAEHNSSSEVQDVDNLKAEGASLRRQVSIAEETDEGSKSAQDVEEIDKLDRSLEDAKRNCENNMKDLHLSSSLTVKPRPFAPVSKPPQYVRPEDRIQNKRPLAEPVHRDEPPNRNTMTAEEYFKRNADKQRELEANRQRLQGLTPRRGVQDVPMLDAEIQLPPVLEQVLANLRDFANRKSSEASRRSLIEAQRFAPKISDIIRDEVYPGEDTASETVPSAEKLIKGLTASYKSLGEVGTEAGRREGQSRSETLDNHKDAVSRASEEGSASVQGLAEFSSKLEDISDDDLQARRQNLHHLFSSTSRLWNEARSLAENAQLGLSHAAGGGQNVSQPQTSTLGTAAPAPNLFGNMPLPVTAPPIGPPAIPTTASIPDPSTFVQYFQQQAGAGGNNAPAQFPPVPFPGMPGFPQQLPAGSTNNFPVAPPPPLPPNADPNAVFAAMMAAAAGGQQVQQGGQAAPTFGFPPMPNMPGFPGFEQFNNTNNNAQRDRERERDRDGRREHGGDRERDRGVRRGERDEFGRDESRRGGGAGTTGGGEGGNRNNKGVYRGYIKGMCRFWEEKGRCVKDDCQWEHPEERRGIRMGGN